MTGSEKLDHILAIVGALVPLLSAVSSLVNHVIRSQQAAGQTVSPVLSGAGTILNLGAVNLDKAVQLAKMMKAGQPLPAETKPADPPAEPPKA